MFIGVVTTTPAFVLLIFDGFSFCPAYRDIPGVVGDSLIAIPIIAVFSKPSQNNTIFWHINAIAFVFIPFLTILRLAVSGGFSGGSCWQNKHKQEKTCEP